MAALPKKKGTKRQSSAADLDCASGSPTPSKQRRRRVKTTALPPTSGLYVTFHDEPTMIENLKTVPIFKNNTGFAEQVAEMYAGKSGITCTVQRKVKDQGYWVAVTLDRETATVVPTCVLVCLYMYVLMCMRYTFLFIYLFITKPSYYPSMYN